MFRRRRRGLGAIQNLLDWIVLNLYYYGVVSLFVPTWAIIEIFLIGIPTPSADPQFLRMKHYS